MGKSPSLIIIVRHGARLDAADPQWHLTSPTPYDPPLTYGGWKQAQALGARIGSIVKFWEDASLEKRNPIHTHHRPRRRDHKIVIHSSPYLRCVQTSVALSAGMDNWVGRVERDSKIGLPKHHTLHSGSPHIHALDPKNSPQLTAIPEPEEEASRRKEGAQRRAPSSKRKDRPTLRLDPFLGEWLSPDYFENITSPPGSKMMLAGAKADLLKRGEPIETRKDYKGRQGHFPGGWTQKNASEIEQDSVADNGFDEGADDQPAPRLARAKTHSAGTSGLRGHRQLSSGIQKEQRDDSSGYSPPIPPYAILPSQPIPAGYVTHARDACVHIDFQWDSMRPPLSWGSGGDYGEEWSAMHRRFRKGLSDMISWYQGHNASQEPGEDAEELHTLQQVRSQPLKDDQDEEDDTILVLVTHGAGCNALIGALTNQPVLIDVGLASLTMAVRKEGSLDGRLRAPSDASSPLRRMSLADARLSAEYDLKLTASTDHLRPGNQFLGGASNRDRSPSLPVREKSPYRYERRVGSPTGQTFRKASPAAKPKSDPQRTTTGSFEEDRSSVPSPIERSTGSPSNGLWSKPSIRGPQTGRPNGVHDKKAFQNGFLGQKQLSVATNSVRHASMSNEAFAAEDDGEPMVASPGLWQAAPKRRWTFNQA